VKKKSKARSTPRKSADMLPEYDFNYRKAKPNRFAGRISKERVVVVLDSEVSQVIHHRVTRKLKGRTQT
jgi:hypothetical protein